MNETAVLDAFHPIIKEWFSKNIGTPSLPQILGWPEIQKGNNVLISAPTGAGKTLAAFLESIDFLLKKGLCGELPEGVFILYVSPLKALNNDIYKNLDIPLKGIEQCCKNAGIAFPEIRKAVRTGDTPQNERQKILKNPPHILITTPESLYLMLTSKNAVKILKNVRYLIVDEIHTMLGTKRGVHLALSIARLEHLVQNSIIGSEELEISAKQKPELVRIGLSATVNPIETAAHYLGGLKRDGDNWIQRPISLVAPNMEKSKDFKIYMPVADYRILEQGTIWPEIYESIHKLIKQHKSTIVFVNNRAVAERVSANVNSIENNINNVTSNKNEEICRPHHGCLSKAKRLEVEEMFKERKLPCIVATSTLELGIDIGSVDFIIQVSSPLSVSSGLQRLGRAGHRLDATSTGRILPKTRGDLLKSAFIANEMLNGDIEKEKIPENSLDVLSQHIVSMSCADVWSEADILEVILQCWSYRNLKEDEFKKVLAMLSGDFEHLDDIPAKPRILWDRKNKTIAGTPYSRMLAVNSSGTIPDRGYFPVVLSDYKTRIGELDEVFVFEARLGDRFMLGNSAWKVEKIEKNRVIVSPSTSVGAKTPFWQGDGIGSPYEQGIAFGKYLRGLDKKLDSDDFIDFLTSSQTMDETAAINIKNYLEDQKDQMGCLSNESRIVVEYLKDDVSDQRIVIHAHFGGKVNSVLAVLLQRALEEVLRCQVYSSQNDDVIMLHIYGCPDQLSNLFSLLKPTKVEEMLIHMLPGTSRFAMSFRYNAYRSLMMGVRSIGQRLPLWIQRLRSVDALENARKTLDHPLIIETMRECLEECFDIPNAIKVLENIQKGMIEVVEKNSWFPSPFASDLLFQFKSIMMYAEKDPHPSDIKSPMVTGVDALNLTHLRDSEVPSVSSAAILEVTSKNNVISKISDVSSINELHSFLLIYGDITPMEVQNDNINDWLLKLLEENRILLLKNSNEIPDLFIAVEETELYLSAFGVSNEYDTWTKEAAINRIIRRFARYHSPFCIEDLINRYGFALQAVNMSLSHLESEELIKKLHFKNPDVTKFCHTKIYEALVLKESYLKANEIVALPSHVYASFLPHWQRIGTEAVSPTEQLYEVIKQLEGLFLPWDLWESIIFPARIKGYSMSHLDKLCALGRVFWRILPESNQKDTLLIAWYCVENTRLDMESFSETHALPNSEEALVLNILKKKGASFVHSLTSFTGLNTSTILDILQNLALKGLVVNDSFIPVRYFMNNQSPKALNRTSVEKAKGMALAVSRMDMGRWELAWKVVENDIQKLIDRWFNRYGLLSRDSLCLENPPYSWNEIYEALKTREYSGNVLRGYFIQGISGIQFMLPEAYKKLNFTSEYHVLNASDPAQVYGKIITRDEIPISFTNIPGTVLVLKAGIPVVVIEKYGERINFSCESNELQGAIIAFKEAFVSKRIWPERKKVTVRCWPEDPTQKDLLINALSNVGFKNDILKMVLFR